LLNTADRVSRLALVAILSPRGTGPGLIRALRWARRRVVFLSRARILGVGNVVIARREGVRVARFLNDTMVLVVLPGRGGITTVATITARIAAKSHTSS